MPCTHPSLFAGSCLSGPCRTPITLGSAAGSTAAAAKMTMGFHMEGEEHGLCSRLCATGSPLQQKDVSSKGGMKPLLIVAKVISDTRLENYFPVMPVVTKLSSALFRMRSRVTRWPKGFKSAGFLRSAMLRAVT